MMWRGRIARSDGDRRRAAPGRRTAAAGRARTRCSSRSRAIASRVRATVSATGRPEVHRPERDLLEDRRGDPGALGVRVLEADDDALGELVGRQARRPASPSSVSVPLRSPPIDAGASPEATRQSVDLPASFGPTSPTISPSSSRRSTSWRTVVRVAGVAVRRRRVSSSIVRAGSGTAGDPARRSPRRARAAAAPGRRAARPLSGIRHRRCRRPGRPNARTSRARLRSSTSVSDDRITGPTSGRTPRRRARTLPSVSRPRARWALAITLGPLDHRRHRLERREGDEREPRRQARAAPGRGRSCAARSSARTGRSTSRSRTAGRASGRRSRRPRAVASNGPIENRTVVPARVKTLTRTTEIAIGSVSSSEIRTSRPATPATTAAGRTARSDDRQRPEVAADHERAERLDGRRDRLRQRVQAVVGATAPAARARRGRRRRRPRASRRRRAGRSRGRWAQPSASPTACSPCGKRATNRRLSAPRIANTTKNVSVLSIGSDSRPCLRTADLEVVAGLLEGGDEEVRAGAGDAAEDDGRDRRRDDRRDDPADEPGDEDVRGAEVAPDEQEGEQPDDARRRAAARRPSRGPRRSGRGRDAVGRRGEERELAVAVERQEAVDRDHRRRSATTTTAPIASRGRRRVRAAPEEARAGRRRRPAARSRPRR